MQDLERELEQRNAELAALREIGRAINAAWALSDTLELITGRTAAVMGADSCSIYLLDEGRTHLVLKATTGLAREAVGRSRLRLGEGLTGWAAQTGEPVAVADAAQDPRFKYLPETNESRFQSLLAVPLVNQGRIIGAINVQTHAYHAHRSDEVELLSLIADLAAGALEKAMLYEENARLATSAALVREMHHRIKNNLQSVIMLLRLQMGGDVPADQVLREAINRIQSIAAVHDELSLKGFQLVDVKGLLGRVANGVAQNMARPGFELGLTVEGEAFSLPSQPATSLALVASELIQNALEHAFVERAAGHIAVRIEARPGQWAIVVADDGVGLAGRPGRHIGLQIAETLVTEDLHGSLTFAGEAGAGTTATITIPRA